MYICTACFVTPRPRRRHGGLYLLPITLPPWEGSDERSLIRDIEPQVTESKDREYIQQVCPLSASGCHSALSKGSLHHRQLCISVDLLSAAALFSTACSRHQAIQPIIFRGS